MTQSTACRIIANVMTNKGFMNGWFGDDSPEFKREQALAMERMAGESAARTALWIECNLFNMVRYCRIPQGVIETAFDCRVCIPAYMLGIRMKGAL